MPELPEVETIRRTLAPDLIGRRVVAVTLHRQDIVTGAARSADLLVNHFITSLERRGKQLAIIAAPRAATPHAHAPSRPLVIHLGMTGQLLFLNPNQQPTQADHIHAQWTLTDKRGRITGTLLFRDPRRFGGLFTYRSLDALNLVWSSLGPDALEPPPHDHPSLARLWRSRRAIKAALLDQSCLAGVGNIYADESLHAARIHPARSAATLTPDERAAILNAIRAILARSIAAGGSTLRDYKDSSGRDGAFQSHHRVYGRGGQPCLECLRPLTSKTLGQRTTVWCQVCQPRRRQKAPRPSELSTTPSQ
ncbi:MAG: bifunctional DNA-formamidopyrimidine glycosylase/DNA-(apurinic or apyrimidinic site) lyase [Phycisphaerae bacterium]|nr:bifunctional DNA-formamidopyrimidine glycosylase/DNA-(apurinic or apyrimidinic site) lyase [Phycisphaerae bacterium]